MPAYQEDTTSVLFGNGPGTVSGYVVSLHIEGLVAPLAPKVLYEYGVVGFVFSLIGAALYNLLASWVGGVEVELEPKSPGAAVAPGIVSTPHA